MYWLFRTCNFHTTATCCSTSSTGGTSQSTCTIDMTSDEALSSAELRTEGFATMKDMHPALLACMWRGDDDDQGCCKTARNLCTAWRGYSQARLKGAALLTCFSQHPHLTSPCSNQALGRHLKAWLFSSLAMAAFRTCQAHTWDQKVITNLQPIRPPYTMRCCPFITGVSFPWLRVNRMTPEALALPTGCFPLRPTCGLLRLHNRGARWPRTAVSGYDTP